MSFLQEEVPEKKNSRLLLIFVLAIPIGLGISYGIYSLVRPPFHGEEISIPFEVDGAIRKYVAEYGSVKSIKLYHCEFFMPGPFSKLSRNLDVYKYSAIVEVDRDEKYKNPGFIQHAKSKFFLRKRSAAESGDLGWGWELTPVSGIRWVEDPCTEGF